VTTAASGIACTLLNLTTERRRHVLYQAEPHYCPVTCKHCGVVYSRIRRGDTVTDDPHHCPGSDEAEARHRALMKKQVALLNQLMARAVRGL
jgi:hypothetical protein